MFLKTEQAEQAQSRRPILVLDETAGRALAATGDLPNCSLYRQAGAVEPLTDAEIGAARNAGGVIVIAEPLSDHLTAWIAQIRALRLAVYPILIVPGGGEPPRRRMRAEREVVRLSRRLGTVFPVYTDRIEHKIHCAHAELRASAQGAAVAGIVEALEHFGPVAFQVESENETSALTAATSFVFHADESIEGRVDHLPEKVFFWDPQAVLCARRIVGRIRVPSGTSDQRTNRWRRALALRFAQAVIVFDEEEGEADEPIRVSLFFVDPAVLVVSESDEPADRIVSILQTTAERVADAEPPAEVGREREAVGGR